MKQFTCIEQLLNRPTKAGVHTLVFYSKAGIGPDPNIYYHQIHQQPTLQSTNFTPFHLVVVITI